MAYLPFIFLATFITCAAIGAAVFLADRYNKTKLTFFAATMALAVFLLFNYFWLRSSLSENALVWLRISFVGFALFPPLLFALVQRVLQPFLKHAVVRIVGIVLFAATPLLVVFSLSPYFVNGVFEDSILFPDTTLAFNGAVLLWLCASAAPFFALKAQYLSSQNILRARIRFLLAGSAFGFFALIGSVLAWYFLTPLSFAVFLFIAYAGFTAYAISATRFIRLKKVFEAAFTYGLSFVSALIFAAALFLLASRARFFHAAAATAVIVAASLIVFLFFIEIFKKVYLSFFGSKDIEDRTRLEKDIKQLTTVLNMEELLEEVVVLVKKVAAVERVAIIIRSEETNSIDRSRIEGFDSGSALFFPYDNPLLLLFQTILRGMALEELFSFVEMRGGGIQRLLEKHKGELASQGMRYFLPIGVRDRFRGLIILGPKVMRGDYTEKDAEILGFFIREASLALENALLYEKVKSFSSYLTDLNKDLVLRVERATKELEIKNKELQMANKHLEELNNIKTEFLNMASHQLRTPTTVIRGMLSMIMNKEVDEKTAASFLQKVFESATRLNNLINDLLNTAYIEGGLILKMENTDMAVFLDHIVEELRQPADAKKLSLVFERKEKEPVFGYIDQRRMHEALYNIVDNAIKYTAQGSVVVSLERTGASSGARALPTPASV